MLSEATRPSFAVPQFKRTCLHESAGRGHTLSDHQLILFAIIAAKVRNQQDGFEDGGSYG
jgi:hypothetical protein